jgi:hypothetical protein
MAVTGHAKELRARRRTFANWWRDWTSRTNSFVVERRASVIVRCARPDRRYTWRKLALISAVALPTNPCCRRSSQVTEIGLAVKMPLVSGCAIARGPSLPNGQ